MTTTRVISNEEIESHIAVGATVRCIIVQMEELSKRIRTLIVAYMSVGAQPLPFTGYTVQVQHRKGRRFDQTWLRQNVNERLLRLNVGSTEWNPTTEITKRFSRPSRTVRYTRSGFLYAHKKRPPVMCVLDPHGLHGPA